MGQEKTARDKKIAAIARREREERERRLRGDLVRGAAINSKGMDHKTKMALAEVLSSGGVNARRVAIEVLFLLPEEFVRTYEDLFHRALSSGQEGRGSRDDAAGEVGKARVGKFKAEKRTTGKAVSGTDSGGETQEEKGRVARRGKGSGGHSRGVFVIKDTEALETKAWADRQLRKLARQIKAGSGAKGGVGKRSRCSGCGKWQEETWLWCPFCGEVTPVR